ncbi:MAG: hypothetical protein GWN84_13435 [Gammaproteobacteria bacterium]|nr:hypothetical protein [Gammaproteobacteria bacterium]NIR83831.1 hypothetical protein [Gammaproteobacteria bacterium]NIV73438.1 hypothetical protein [Gammaproteobacteria bacterium]
MAQVALEILLFTAAAVFLYWLADRILVRIELARGEPLPYRQLVYFLIILGLALALFEVIERVLTQAG